VKTEMQIDRSSPPAPGPLRPFHFPAISRFELSNGLPVLFAASEGFGVATMSVIVDAGGVHDGRGKAGLAALSADLLESGAGSRSAVQIADEIERLGLQLGAASSWDATHVELTGLTSTMRAGAEVVSDLVRRPAFPEAEVERIRHEQLAGIVQRRAEPRGLANEMATRFIFSDASPFALPLTGTTESVEGLTRSDVEEFHASRFSPWATTVVIAGDLSVDEARRLAEEGFGSWAGPAAPSAAAEVAPRFEETHIVLVDRPGAVQSELRVGHVGVDRATPDYFPIVVMNAILGGAFSSRLNMSLRERHGFTYGVTSSFIMRREPGPFLVSTAVQTEVTAAALTEIFNEMRRIREAPVRENELVDARSYLAGTFPLRLQTTGGLASRLAEIAIHDLPIDYFDGYRDCILRVTGDEVLRAAREFIEPERATVVIVGDASVIRPSIEALDLGPVDVVDASGNA
jgi:zinc protease